LTAGEGGRTSHAITDASRALPLGVGALFVRMAAPGRLARPVSNRERRSETGAAPVNDGRPLVRGPAHRDRDGAGQRPSRRGQIL